MQSTTACGPKKWGKQKALNGRLPYGDQGSYRMSGEDCDQISTFARFFARFWQFFCVFGGFRTPSDAFGSIRIHSDASGHIRMRSDAFGNFGKFLEVFRNNLYSFDDSERFQRFLEIFGCVRMHSDVFGSFWKLPEIFRFFEKCPIFSDMCLSMYRGLFSNWARLDELETSRIRNDRIRNECSVDLGLKKS